MRQSVIALACGLLLGAGAFALLRPSPPPPPAELIDGKHLVVRGEDGHWIYERTDSGFKVIVKELSPQGLRAIWELQRDYVPALLGSGAGELLSVPATQYSTETGQFRVVHHFYQLKDGKLVEVPMESAPAPR